MHSVRRASPCRLQLRRDLALSLFLSFRYSVLLFTVFLLCSLVHKINQQLLLSVAQITHAHAHTHTERKKQVNVRLQVPVQSSRSGIQQYRLMT